MATRETGETRKKQIIYSSLKIISEKGLESLTIAEIAKDIGIAEGTIFRHFSSKKEIMEEAMKFVEFMMDQETAKKYIDEQKAFSAVEGVYQENPVFEGIKGNFETGAITSFPDHYYPAGMGAENLVQEFLIKPYTVEELEEAIKRVCTRLTEERRKLAQTQEQQEKQEQHLKQLAREYAKARRADDKAIEVFEQLANNPQCEILWLKTLAMMYVIRQEWGKLKTLATRLENTPPR